MSDSYCQACAALPGERLCPSCWREVERSLEDRPVVMAFAGKHRLGPQASDGTLTEPGLIVVDNDTRTLAILPVGMSDPEVWQFCALRGWACRGVVRLPKEVAK